MKTFTLTTLGGLAATAAATFGTACVGSDCGVAMVVNYCSNDVYISNTPSGGDPLPTDVLSTGQNYNQTYTVLPDLCGWSIKISPDSSMDNQMQYEYTWTGGDATVWYDMSLVDASATEAPFSWEFVSNDASCQPNNSHVFTQPKSPEGMQTECSYTASLTLNLCFENAPSGSSASPSSAPSSSASVASYSAPPTASSAPESTYVAPTATSSAAPTTLQTYSSQAYNSENNAAVTPSATLAAPTTSAASYTTTTTAAAQVVGENNGNLIVETEVDYVTQIETTYVQARAAEATPVRKRHVHGHPHGARS